jgi:hypothetical protein
MQQADTIQLVPKASSVFKKVIRMFGRSRYTTPQPNPIISKIDWHDSDSDSKLPYCGRDNQPVSGGYNEAFIVQYWTNYDLR